MLCLRKNIDRFTTLSILPCMVINRIENRRDKIFIV